MSARIIDRTETGFTVQVTIPYNRSMLEFEETLQDRLNAAGVLATEEGRRQFDTDGSPITIGSVTFTSNLFSAGGGDHFQRFSGAGWPAGCEHQAHRTRSHRFTHQPHGPMTATFRAPDPARPRRRVGPRKATPTGSRL